MAATGKEVLNDQLGERGVESGERWGSWVEECWACLHPVCSFSPITTRIPDLTQQDRIHITINPITTQEG